MTMSPKNFGFETFGQTTLSPITSKHMRRLQVGGHTDNVSIKEIVTKY